MCIRDRGCAARNVDFFDVKADLELLLAPIDVRFDKALRVQRLMRDHQHQRPGFGCDLGHKGQHVGLEGGTEGRERFIKQEAVSYTH